MVHVSDYSLDLLLLILGIIITISSMYSTYASIRMQINWRKWLFFILIGITTITSAVTSGIFLIENLKLHFLVAVSLIILINYGIEIKKDFEAYKYY